MPEVLKPIPPPVPEYDGRPGDAALGTVEIYDTTLRDGAQTEEISYSVEDKLKILRALDRLGVQFVEGGGAFAAICALADAGRALAGHAGTRITH